MKRTNLTTCALLVVIFLSVISVFAQDNKMDMNAMSKDEKETARPQSVGYHALVMAHRQNALAFSTILWEIASTGNIEDIRMARAAFAEIKRSIEKMDEIKQMHMAGMGKTDPAQLEKMKPMIEKMGSDSAALKGQIGELEIALQGASPDARNVEARAGALLLRLKKMSGPEMKMDAAEKKTSASEKMDHHKMVMGNGEKAMGFSQTATNHHFLITKNGGAIQVEANDSKDTANRDMIRTHLTEIAKQFKSGDFATPFAVHGQPPTGVSVMEQLKDKIVYVYEETASGARVRIKTNDPQALAAIHAFLKFQIEDHQTGDPTN
jgi:hypothetical protein